MPLSTDEPSARSTMTSRASIFLSSWSRWISSISSCGKLLCSHTVNLRNGEDVVVRVKADREPLQLQSRIFWRWTTLCQAGCLCHIPVRMLSKARSHRKWNRSQTKSSSADSHPHCDFSCPRSLHLPCSYVHFHHHDSRHTQDSSAQRQNRETRLYENPVPGAHRKS